MMEDDVKAAMLAELEEFAQIDRRLPGDVSLSEFSNHLKMTPKAAKRRADAMVDAGRWTTHRVKDGQHWMQIWRRLP